MFKIQRELEVEKAKRVAAAKRNRESVEELLEATVEMLRHRPVMVLTGDEKDRSDD